MAQPGDGDGRRRSARPNDLAFTGGGPCSEVGGVHEGGGCEEKAGEDIGADDVSPLGFSAREALSAWYDGERADADPSDVAGHVTACARCTAFQRALGAIEDLADSTDDRPAPTLGIDQPRLARPAVRSALRISLR